MGWIVVFTIHWEPIRVPNQKSMQTVGPIISIKIFHFMREIIRCSTSDFSPKLLTTSSAPKYFCNEINDHVVKKITAKIIATFMIQQWYENILIRPVSPVHSVRL
ncbi:unnamed protein product [Calicophoron daubneyi]|uniref:Uncharacterized protein n=1 Tax=Calicophoron daubneyi TaxID=300641 RepID=A0AAV2TQP3_CALDB